MRDGELSCGRVAPERPTGLLDPVSVVVGARFKRIADSSGDQSAERAVGVGFRPRWNSGPIPEAASQQEHFAAGVELTRVTLEYFPVRFQSRLPRNGGFVVIVLFHGPTLRGLDFHGV